MSATAPGVLSAGIPRWEYLFQELGFGSGATCWRRPAARNEAGVRGRLHALLPKQLRSQDQLDWPRGDRILSCPVRSPRPKSEPGPVDRARPGSKHHIVTTDQGIPRGMSLAGGNRGRRHPVPDLPDMLIPDRGYDHDKYRRLLRGRGIGLAIDERGQPYGTGPGISRRVVERTVSRLHGFRRLHIRREGRDGIHEAFLGLAVRLVAYRHVLGLCH
ncbi:IS5/IS1182 family transposase [Streptomyces phaeoluteigriseus]|uniref:IS5/IS1182 family transposase n=1 Tax=Streptomyces phaeoluteigriseus TaxID=114686 RepID=A0ABY4ZA20_9ACTN|nr:IS5/IS1182 family transposase [Streptomyces phaeoluteigriseus]USQ85545.1 IS5/IS1182 family transposase [Streptomyces phaeoluteigriseus]